MKSCILFLYYFLILTLYALFISAAPNGDEVAHCGAGRFVANSECCKWFDILDDIQDVLFGGQCDDDARESIRLQFHDAISYSKQLGSAGGGGADGSILAHAEQELAYAENTGLDGIVWEQRALAVKHNVSFGDFLNFAGPVGLSNCRNAPSLKFFVGRPNVSTPSPDDLIPAPWHSVDQILARMEDAGFSPEETVALLSAHSVAVQHTTDPMADGASLDSTPETFDNRFFVETSLDDVASDGNQEVKGVVPSPFAHQLRIQSDYLVARDERTAPTWSLFSSDPEEMSFRFVQAMAKLSTLGQDTSTLVDCSDVIPGHKRFA